MNKIDFVITWVDGSDPMWLKEKKKYDSTQIIYNNNYVNRYKDYGLLKYWFRGVEKYASWVNKIYFITWGHLPPWLDTSNPKLVIINHKDYIPKKYLPTFNSNVIELNINRIKELSENFVLFNDDTIIIKKTNENDFFKNELPCDTVALNVHCPQKSRPIQSISNNNTGIINEYFDFKSSIKKNKSRWFNIKNGKAMFRTFALLKCPRFPGFYQSHLPASHKKSIFEKMWEIEPEIMDLTSNNKFRKPNEINHWLMKAWYIAEGNVYNRSPKFGKTFFIGSDIDNQQNKIIKYIKKQKGKIICINDGDLTDDKYNESIKRIIDAFNTILPEKSSFEK